MIKDRPSFPKLAKSIPKNRIRQCNNSQNIKPKAFNIKGTSDQKELFDEEYIRAKQKVFLKYRDRAEQYVMLDIKDASKGAFIQRGCLIPIKDNNETPEQVNYFDKARTNLLKHYLYRKERKEVIQSEKYSDPSNLNIQFQSRVNSQCRSFSRHISSRISSNSHLKSQYQP